MDASRFDPSEKYKQNPFMAQLSPPSRSPPPPLQPLPGRPLQALSGSSSEDENAPTSPDSSHNHESPNPEPPCVLIPATYRSHAPASLMIPPLVIPPELLSPVIPSTDGANWNLIPMYQQAWSTGILDCLTDIKTCCLTLICPFLTFGQVSEILNEGRTNRWEYATLSFSPMCCSGCNALFAYIIRAPLDPTNEFWASISTSTLLNAVPYVMFTLTKFFYVLVFLGVCMYRTKMRKKFNLEGNCFGDFLLASFYTHLVLCQQYRQLHRFGYDVSLGWRANKFSQKKVMKNLRTQLVPPEETQGMT